MPIRPDNRRRPSRQHQCYGWEYLCMVQGDDGEQMRMYKKDTSL